MKRLITLFIVIGLFSFSTTSILAYSRIGGFYRRNGTYVKPYYRSNPNALRYDNYGYKGGSRYNRSYFGSGRSYSSKWYKPSYLTDPNYYSGKSLYNSNR